MFVLIFGPRWTNESILRILVDIFCILGNLLSEIENTHKCFRFKKKLNAIGNNG